MVGVHFPFKLMHLPIDKWTCFNQSCGGVLWVTPGQTNVNVWRSFVKETHIQQIELMRHTQATITKNEQKNGARPLNFRWAADGGAAVETDEQKQKSKHATLVATFCATKHVQNTTTHMQIAQARTYGRNISQKQAHDPGSYFEREKREQLQQRGRQKERNRDRTKQHNK